MFSIARARFLDRFMVEDDLDAVAGLWINNHREKREYSPTGWAVYYRIEARLWGFARDEGQAVGQLLMDRAAAEEVSLERLHQTDPDTLVLTSPLTTRPLACPFGRWLRLFR